MIRTFGRRQRPAFAALGLSLGLLAPLGSASLASEPLFQPYVEIAVPSEPDAVRVGDVTGDGRDDVVVTTGYANDPVNDFSLFVLPQLPDGLLGAPVRYDTAGTYPSRPSSVDIGDIDGDGIVDVVVGIDRVGIEVFPGRPDGTLGASTLSPNANSTRVRVGQLHPMGGLDVAGIGWGSDTVTVFVDPGGGLDGFATYAAEHNGYDDLEVADVTGDGRDDMIVMSGQGFGPNVSVLAQNPGGGFASAVAYSASSTNVLTHGVGVGDTNGDGRNDIAASYGGNSPSSRVVLWVQTQTGGLDFPVTHESYDIPGPVEGADLDLDGRADMVTIHDGWLQAGVYLGREAGHLAMEQLYPLPSGSHTNPHGLAIGDVNDDGWPDIVAADSANGLFVLRNRRVTGATEPGSPTLTSAVAGDGQVTLSWSPPLDDGGSPVTNYLAEASTGPYCFVFGSTTCTITGLTNGATYTFTVRAGNEVGLGPKSNALSRMPGVVPSAPRSLATSPNLAGGVGLTWQAPSFGGDPALRGFRIYRGVSGGALVLHATVNVSASSFTDTAVVNGGSYAYQVAAFSDFGEGPRTAVVGAQRGTAPGAPRSLAASSGPKGITLTWLAPTSNGGAAVTAYRVFRSTSSGTESFLVSVNGSTLTYQDKAITKRAKYFYWVTAVNVLGEGPHSNEASATAK